LDIAKIVKEPLKLTNAPQQKLSFVAVYLFFTQYFSERYWDSNNIIALSDSGMLARLVSFKPKKTPLPYIIFF